MEVFSQLLVLAKIMLVVVSVIALLIIIAAAIEYYIHRGLKEKEAEMRAHIINSLIAILIVVAVYLLLAAIGPAFNLLF
jgi:putative copper export protein